MFLVAISLAWCSLPVAIHAAESTSYKFYEQFAGDEQPTMRESTTYQFRERDAADATSYKTTDAPPAVVQNSSAAASTPAASTTNGSGDGGGEWRRTTRTGNTFICINKWNARERAKLGPSA